MCRSTRPWEVLAAISSGFLSLNDFNDVCSLAFVSALDLALELRLGAEALPCRLRKVGVVPREAEALFRFGG